MSDDLAFYTFVPRVRDPSNLVWSDSCCSGNWKVKSGNDWITMLPSNTRVRDSDNKRWIEICQGHVVEIAPQVNADGSVNVNKEYPYDCQAYSMEAQEVRSRAGPDMSMVAIEQNSVFGQFISISNTDDIVAILYHIDRELRLHVKQERVFTDFPIDTVSQISATLDGSGHVFYVSNQSTLYTVNIDTQAISESTIAAIPTQPIPTTNTFGSVSAPFGIGISSFVPGTLTVSYLGNTYYYPTGATITAFMTSTVAQSYLLEVYEDEFHFARLRL